MTDDHQALLDALCRNVAGKPAAVCDWRDLIYVRDVVDGIVNGEANRRQSEGRP